MTHRICSVFIAGALSWMAMGITEVSAASRCVQIYYDASPDSSYLGGKEASIALRNLLGHFPEFEVRSKPIESYEAGGLARCSASFYLGTYYDNPLPAEFLRDFARAEKPVMWVGYSIWQLSPARLIEALDHEYEGLSGLNKKIKDKKGRPTFFRHVQYRGETFEKFGEYEADGSFGADPDLVLLRKKGSSATILAEAIHSGTQERRPYAIRKGNRFYVADYPFSYMHEADRYLVFADLLFDVLGAKPRYSGKKPAVFRMEDVSSYMPADKTVALGQLLAEERIPFHVALIPIFADPFGQTGLDPSGEGLPLHQDPRFMKTLSTLRRQGARFIWHGVTHQWAHRKNPTNGVSGEDYEFWDTRRDSPLPDDSTEYVLALLERGWQALQEAGISPRIWEVPHYQASALDYSLFARLFEWNIGRFQYAVAETQGLPSADDPRLWFANPEPLDPEERLAAFESFEIDIQGGHFGQFFPYEIERDVHGQRIIPENIGYAQGEDAPAYALGPRTLREMAANAKRNRVLRDQWASFFVHPYILEDIAADSEKVRRFVRAIRSYGYEFIDLEEFISDRHRVELSLLDRGP